jgi:hypothetical protein
MKRRRTGLYFLSAAVIVSLTALRAIGSPATVQISGSLKRVAVGPPVPRMFMGYSIEWGLAGRMLVARDGRFTAMESAIKKLEAFTGPMLLRIGGNSEDEAAFDLPDVKNLPKFVHINITRRSLEDLRKLARATGCRYVIGLNLGVNRPALAVRLVKAALRYVGRRHIAAFEIGNEADFLGRFGRWWKHNHYAMYLRRWTRYDHDIAPYLGRIKIEGPAFGGEGWFKHLPGYLRKEHARLGIVSLHRYPLGATITNPNSPIFADIHNLLKAGTAMQFATEMKWVVHLAKPYHLPVRFGEMNSAWGGGKEGVSNTFASTLWAATTLLGIAQVGGAGVNLHMSQGVDQFPGWYGPLRFGPRGHLHRMPEYYGMLAAAEVIQDGGEPVLIRLHTKLNVSAFAFQGPHHLLRVAVINRTPSTRLLIHLNLPSDLKLIRGYRVEAPSLKAVRGVMMTGYRTGGSAASRLIPHPLPRRHSTTDGRLISSPASSIVIRVYQY